MFLNLMKNRGKSFFFVIFSLAVVSFLFLGCQNTEQKAPIIDDQPMERRVGELKSLGSVVMSNQGTHLLQMDNGDIIVLRSLQVNLDDPTYVNKIVEVRGVLQYTSDNKQLMDVMNIDVLDETPHEIAKAPQWREYINPSAGFQLKYRDDLKLKEETDENSNTLVIFTREVAPVQKSEIEETSQTSEVQVPGSAMKKDIILHSFTVTKDSQSNISKESSDSHLLELMTQSKIEDLQKEGIARSKIGIDSLDAFKQVRGDQTIYHLLNNDNWYRIVIETGNADDMSLEDQNLFYEMLATFKLITIDSAPSNANPVETSKSMGAAAVEETNTSSSESEEVRDMTEEDLPITPTAAVVAPVKDFVALQSESYGFEMQYPKNWYYAGTPAEEQGVLRHYDFDSQKLEEGKGLVTLDVMNSAIPSNATQS